MSQHQQNLYQQNTPPPPPHSATMPATTWPMSRVPRLTPPQFRRDDVDFTIQQFDIFLASLPTEFDKANAFLLSIPYEVQKSIPNLLPSVSSSLTPYSTLCDLLRRHLSPSDATRFHELLKHEVLGDCLPSQLLTLSLIHISEPTRLLSI